MPKLTFFNLPENKRKTLIEAAEEEFTRVPLFEASISNIIKMAGIPRGSFYQYFQDKEDLYFYLLDEKLKTTKSYFIDLLGKHKGDIIAAIMEMYYHVLVIIPDEEERNFLRNAVMYTTHKVESSFTKMFEPSLDNHDFKDVMELVDKQLLNIKEDQELLHILKIVSAIALHNFIEKTVKQLTDDEAMESFTASMDLIKRGIHNNKKEENVK